MSSNSTDTPVTHSSHSNSLLRSSPLLFGFILITVLFVVVRCGFGWNRVFRESLMASRQNGQRGTSIFVDLAFLETPFSPLRKPELWDIAVKGGGTGCYYWREMQPMAANVLSKTPKASIEPTSPQSSGSAVARAATRRSSRTPTEPLQTSQTPSHEGDVLELAFLIQMPSQPQKSYHPEISEKPGVDTDDSEEYYDIGITNATVSQPTHLPP